MQKKAGDACAGQDSREGGITVARNGDVRVR